MNFDLSQAEAVLSKTPATLDALLKDLPDEWTKNNEGLDTWSPYDVIGHLIHGEKTDWIPRAKMILEHGELRTFDTFDRFAMFTESKGKTLEQLLEEFGVLRTENLRILGALQLTPAQLERTGTHPTLGRVTLKQLLATWVAHDLDHVGQIVRTMAKQYSNEVGPWSAFLSILRERQK
ncbi:MAG: DinB family protein [Ignavibacteriae bacterium]|nr:DinB family protein [Ignavibacteriota bacterium]